MNNNKIGHFFTISIFTSINNSRKYIQCNLTNRTQ